MDKTAFIYSKQEELYAFYNSRIRWVIVFIETRFKKFPVPILNEIRAAQDHIARCFENDETVDEAFVARQMDMAKGHYLRCLLDGYKYIWYYFGWEIKKKFFWAKLLGKLSDINNGEFAQKMAKLRKDAKDNNWNARLQESKNKDLSIDLYEKAIGKLEALDNLYEENINAIQWSIRKGAVLKALAALGWIISMGFTVAKYWKNIVGFISGL